MGYSSLSKPWVSVHAADNWKDLVPTQDIEFSRIWAWHCVLSGGVQFEAKHSLDGESKWPTSLQVLGELMQLTPNTKPKGDGVT